MVRGAGDTVIYRTPADASLRAEVEALRAENERLLNRGPVRIRYDAMTAREVVAFVPIVLGWPLAIIAPVVAAHVGGGPAIVVALTAGTAWWFWAVFFGLRD